MASNFNQPNFSQGRPRIQGDSSARPLIPNNALLDVPSTPRPVQGSAMADTISAAATQPQVNSAAVQPQGQQQAPVQQAPVQQPVFNTQALVPNTTVAPADYIAQGYADFGQGGPTPYGTKPGEIFKQEAQGMAPATYTQSPFDVDPATKARQEIENSVNRQIADQQAQANRRAAAVGLQGGIAAQGAQAIATSGAEALAGQLSKFDLEQQALADQKAFQQWQQDFTEMINEQGAGIRDTEEKQALQDLWYSDIEALGKLRQDLEDVWGMSPEEVDLFIDKSIQGGMSPKEALRSLESDRTSAETEEQVVYSSADASTAALSQQKKDALPYGNDQQISGGGGGDKSFWRDPGTGDVRMYEWDSLTKTWTLVGKGSQSEFLDWWD